MNLANEISCNMTAADNSTYTCLVGNSEQWCEGGSCFNYYIGVVCAISILGSVMRSALPALGGDQVDNNLYFVERPLTLTFSQRFMNSLCT